MELNTKPMVISLNAYYIDRYLCIHIYELIDVIFLVYREYLTENEDIKVQLSELQKDIEVIVLEFLKSLGTEKLDISKAPEITRVRDSAVIDKNRKQE